MTFWRWLLVHSLSICILVMLGFGYYFKNELKLNEAYNQLLQIDTDKISLPTHSKNVASNTKDAEKMGDKNIASSPKKTVTISRVKPVEKPPVNELFIDSPSVDDTSVKIKESKSENTLEVAEEKLIPIDNLLMARQAYWKKDYSSSIEYYSKEININKSSPDLYGELGNVYYSMKDYDLASQNYLKAGEILIKLNDETRAKQIYDILISIAPDKANSLLLLKNQKYQ